MLSRIENSVVVLTTDNNLTLEIKYNFEEVVLYLSTSHTLLILLLHSIYFKAKVTN